MNLQYECIKIKTRHTDKDGQLSFFEGSRDIPFEIKRIYYITGVSAESRRGAHAHKTLKQLLFCPFGRITIELNNGVQREKIVLDNPEKGLIIYPGLWRDMVWHQDNSVLCVAASEYYDEGDYIRNYDEFLNYVRMNKDEDSVC